MAAKVLVDADQVRRTIARIAHEIVERHPDPSRLALVGIHTRGVPLAARLAELIGEFAGTRPAIGTVDIALYRDDVGLDARRGALPVVGDTVLDFDVSDRAVILVDDVLFTGRTIRAAIDAVFDSANAPQIVFRSTSVKRTGDTTAVIAGRLTARGKSSPEVFTARLDSLKSGGALSDDEIAGKLG